MAQRAPAHVGERRDLQDAALLEARDLLEVDEVEERVVDRAHVGVELGLQVAGQEAQALASLDHGARDDEAPALAVAQRAHGRRDREVGLARAARTDAEGERVLLDHLEVAALVLGARLEGIDAQSARVDARARLGPGRRGSVLGALEGRACAQARTRSRRMRTHVAHGTRRRTRGRSARRLAAEQDRLDHGVLELAALAALAQQMLDAPARFLHAFVGALEAQVSAAREDLDLQILPQQLGVAVVRTEDQDGLVVRAQRDGDLGQVALRIGEGKRAVNVRGRSRARLPRPSGS